MIPKRFLAFIEEIAEGGDWEYAGGDSMTADAKLMLAEIRIWQSAASYPTRKQKAVNMFLANPGKYSIHDGVNLYRQYYGYNVGRTTITSALNELLLAGSARKSVTKRGASVVWYVEAEK